jgi:hypothetical protein
MATYLPLVRQAVVKLAVRFADALIAHNSVGEYNWTLMGRCLSHNDVRPSRIAHSVQELTQQRLRHQSCNRYGESGISWVTVHCQKGLKECGTYMRRCPKSFGRRVEVHITSPRQIPLTIIIVLSLETKECRIQRYLRILCQSEVMI